VSDTSERELASRDVEPQSDGTFGWPAPESLREPPPAPPFSWPPSSDHGEEEFHHPLDRVTGRLPKRARIAVDWVVTIVGAVAIVLAIKAWVVNPYRIPSSSMEPTLHCARPAPGCEARFSDRVLANRFVYHFRSPKRGEVIVFKTRLRNGLAYVYIDGRRLDEPYIEKSRRDVGPAKSYRVPLGDYFVMGDNRSQSCDSRVWGPVPRQNVIGKVFMTYWPPQRLSFR
jgi:signal peptidase I